MAVGCSPNSAVALLGCSEPACSSGLLIGDSALFLLTYFNHNDRVYMLYSIYYIF